MIAVVCFQWNTGFREYLPEHVNVLAGSVRRNLPLEHRFYCITDETEGFSEDVTVLPLPEEARPLCSLKNPCGDRFPSSYRRLWLFSKEAAALGDRIFQTDIDCVITDDLSLLFEPDEDFIGWRPNFVWGNGDRIGGGTWLLKPGTRAEIWERMSTAPDHWIGKAFRENYRGSDQAIMSYMLKGCTVWPKKSGIYQAQDMKRTHQYQLPSDARIVHFNGQKKAWQMRHIPWIKEHWRGS